MLKGAGMGVEKGTMCIWIVREVGSVDCLVSHWLRAIKIQPAHSSSHRPPSSSVRHAALPSVGHSVRFSFSSSSLCRSTSASLPSQSFWNKFKNKKSDKDTDYRGGQSHMALARQRLLTLAYGDMETVRVVSLLPSLSPDAHSFLPSAATKLSCEDSRSIRFISPPTDTDTLGARGRRQRLDKASPRCHLQLASAYGICFSPCLCSSLLILLRSSPLRSHLAISLRTVHLRALSAILLTQCRTLISSLDRVVQRM